jgi:hypothetical protein
MGGQTLTEIGVSGPEGAGLGFLTLKEHSPNARPWTRLGELIESPYWVAGLLLKQAMLPRTWLARTSDQRRHRCESDHFQHGFPRFSVPVSPRLHETSESRDPLPLSSGTLDLAAPACKTRLAKLAGPLSVQ